MKRFMKILGTIVIVLVVLLIVGGFLPVAKEPNSESLNIKMPDGTDICVRLRLPEEAVTGEQVPVAMEMTRYGTEYLIKAPLKNIVNLLRQAPNTDDTRDILIDNGYAVMKVDMRGSGASGGVRETAWSPKEVEDIYHIIDWAATQTWSDGNVGVFGESYSGNTSEWAASVNHPALKVVAPLYSDFDPIRQLAYPGGLLHESGVQLWQEFNHQLDTETVEDLPLAGHAPADDDKGGKQLRAYVEARKNGNIEHQLNTMRYLDDDMTSGIKGTDLALYNAKDSIEAGNVPFIIFEGWMDAQTVNGALERFNTLSNNQTVYLGPWNHCGEQFYDPLLSEDMPIDAPPEASIASITSTEKPYYYLDQMMVDFFDLYLKESTVESEKIIHYYTLGTGKWHSTSQWPMTTVQNESFYMTTSNGLQGTPIQEAVIKTLNVDETFTTGEANRWYGNFAGGFYDYSQFGDEAEKLMSFTTEPMTEDRTITGNPVVTMNLSTNQSAGAVYIYLQDVAPDGTITYLTEGVLNLAHRKVNDDVPYVTLDANHSLLEADMQAVVPNEVMTLEVPLYAISAQIRQGHSIRISIGGHDASGFKNLNENVSEDIVLKITLDETANLSLPFEK